MREYVFDELGFFGPETCERIKKAMDGKTYMKFKVEYSNCAGNCTLFILTDYEGTEEEIKNFFISAAFYWLSK